jgi:hypothetical protein
MAGVTVRTIQRIEQGNSIGGRNGESMITFVIVAIIFLFAMGDEPLVWWLFGGIGIGVIVQGLIAFEVISFFSPGWGKRFVEKRLGRRL